MQTFNTQLTADCVEWCRWQEDLFVCGTYQLENEKRRGKLFLFECFEDENEEKRFNLKQTIETNAIFDLKWFEEKSSFQTFSHLSLQEFCFKSNSPCSI